MSNPTDRHRPARSTGHGSRRRVRGEKGYALVLTALMLLPLLAFTGFATDVGAWYARASRIQRAADAASHAPEATPHHALLGLELDANPHVLGGPSQLVVRAAVIVGHDKAEGNGAARPRVLHRLTHRR